MSIYTAPIGNLVAFNFGTLYTIPNGNSVAFNLGVDSGGGVVPDPISGDLLATTDDATGAFLGAFDYPFVSIVSEVLAPVQQYTPMRDETLLKFESSFALNYATEIKTEQGFPRSRDVIFKLEAAQDVHRNWKISLQDCNEYTHVFDNSLFKEPPVEFAYTPIYEFNFGINLNEWTLSTTTQEYVAKTIPLEFDLINSVYTGAICFDLGLTETQAVTRTRKIFDNVSTYQPKTDFFSPIFANGIVKNHSYQRAGFRLSNTNRSQTAKRLDKNTLFVVQQAQKLAKNHLFKLEAAARFSKIYELKQQAAQRFGVDFIAKNRTATALIKRILARAEISRVIWNTPPAYGGSIVDPPRPPLPPNPPHNPNGETFTIQTKTVYTMQNTITITLTDLTPIDVSDVSLSLDAESWAWQFSCKLLNPEQLPLITAVDDVAKELIVTINGFEWRVLAEKTSHTRTFANDAINLSGRCLSALLTQPYLQPRSATQSDLLTVQQLAELELPNGWTIDWQAATWNVPAGAFSYTAKTPMQVISEIAADIGAMVVPSRNAKTLKITPRYPVLPWQFDQAVPNLVIPDSALQSLTYRAVIPAQANGVYVHGGEIGGVIGWCRLTGTDGARLSQTVNNALMTSVVGCRALGERILAGQYTQPALQSVTLPMNATDMPLANVGDLIRVNVDGSQVRGIVNSVSISAGLGNVSQTLQIGEETANVWSAFKQILPSEPLFIGAVSSVSGETSLMTLIDGGVVRVRGVGTVGQKYYIRAGRLENEAPNLVLSEIVV